MIGLRDVHNVHMGAQGSAQVRNGMSIGHVLSGRVFPDESAGQVLDRQCCKTIGILIIESAIKRIVLRDPTGLADGLAAQDGDGETSSTATVPG